MEPRKVVRRSRELPGDRETETPPPSEADMEELRNAVAKMEQQNRERRARMSPEERAADDAAKEDRLRAARAHAEAWIKDPPWFSFYDPYRSVLSGQSPRFVDSKGELVPVRQGASSSVRELLHLAKKAADRYLQGQHLTVEEWKTALSSFKKFIRDISKEIPFDRIQFVDIMGNPVEDPGELPDDPFSILSLHQQLLERHADKFSREDWSVVGMLHTLWCVICLSEIDHALLSCMYEDAGDGIFSAMRARDALSNAERVEGILAGQQVLGREDRATDGDHLVATIRQDLARSGAAAKWAAHPVGQAKAEVQQLWQEWQRQPSRYRSKAAFARDMLDKFEALGNQAVIVRWCTEWEKEQAA